MEKGNLIEFREQGERRLAVADRPEGKKDWLVLDAQGHSYKLRPQRIEYEVAGGPYLPEDITAFQAEVEPYIDPDSLEIAWELLSEDKSTVTPEQLAQLLFSEKTPASCYAGHCLLADDKIYFKRKGDLYEPRSESQVAEIKHQLAVEQQRIAERTKFVASVEKAIAGTTVNWEPYQTRLQDLEQYVLDPDSKFARAAKETLALLGKNNQPQTAFELLIELGIWETHENLFLRRSGYPVNLPKKVLAVVQDHLASLPPDLDAAHRVDLTHLKTFTIDDEDTREIDDGLSVESLPDGQSKIWVHIADPTRLVNPGDELDLAARRRGTSLYLPTGSVSMFPRELAVGPMSLVQAQICNALSFGVILKEDGGIQDYEICASLVKPTYRLTYEDVDDILGLGIIDEPEVAVLADTAKLRSTWRQAQGSIAISMPDSVIKVRDDGDIVIEILEDSRSRNLVAEMMILASEIAGRYAQDHELPVPFRGQPQPELPSDEELLALPAGPVRSCAVRRCMPRSETGTVPARHASLGLDVYSQATSPIRRYTDLITHFQLKAHLRGDSLPFSTEQVQEILHSVVPSSQEATLVERQTNRYWTLEYLRRESQQTWGALMLRWLREHERLGLILLEDLGIELTHRFEDAITVGDRFMVTVTYADPRRDEIRFQVLSDSPPEPAHM
ncbi:MAG: ribonuclease R family protein [Cyanobacteria bacterium P01_H01_bin.15]